MLAQRSPNVSKGYERALKLYIEEKHSESLAAIRQVFDESVSQDRLNLRFLASFNYMALQNYNSATLHARLAARENPQKFQPAVIRARVLRARKKPYQAVVILSKAIQKFGDIPELLLSLAFAFYESKQYRKANFYLRKLLIKQPQNFYAVYLDGILLLKKGKFDSAEFRLKNALAIRPITPKDLVLIYNHLGIVAERDAARKEIEGSQQVASKRYDEANRYYVYALSIDPNESQVLANQKRLSLRR